MIYFGMTILMMFQLGEGKLTNISQVTIILLSIFDLF